MSWVQIRPRTGRSREQVLLSIAGRRLADGRTAVQAKLTIPEAVLRQAGLAPAHHVEIYLGRDEHAGKIALRGARHGPDAFRLAKYGAGARLAFDAGLLGLGRPQDLAREVVPHRVAGDMIELTLPAGLGARPNEPPCAAPAAPVPPAPAAVAAQDRGGAAAVDRREPAPQSKRRHGDAWTAADDEQLRRMRAEGVPKSTMAKLLGRTPAAIALRMSKLRLSKRDATGPAGPACDADRPGARTGGDSVVAAALTWLQRQGVPVDPLGSGAFRIAGETVTALRLVQIANDRRARHSPLMPQFPLPSPDRVRPGLRPE